MPAAPMELRLLPYTPERDVYRLLGLPANASADEITAACRRLARTFHPDRNGVGSRHPGDAGRQRRAADDDRSLASARATTSSAGASTPRWARRSSRPAGRGSRSMSRRRRRRLARAVRAGRDPRAAERGQRTPAAPLPGVPHGRRAGRCLLRGVWHATPHRGNLTGADQLRRPVTSAPPSLAIATGDGWRHRAHGSPAWPSDRPSDPSKRVTGPNANLMSRGEARRAGQARCGLTRSGSIPSASIAPTSSSGVDSPSRHRPWSAA